MPQPQVTTMSRVRSRDGTPIAYWTSGEGPPMVLVHGMTTDHTSWRLLAPLLDPHVTVHAIDRRGRGGSGDEAGYDPVREFEDVAAVVDEVAAASGSPVGLFGHSFGALCALGGATLTDRVRRLVLYEPGVSPSTTWAPGLLERVEALLAGGRNESVLETFYRDGLGMSDDDVTGLRALPSWGPRAAAAHTVPRELRAEGSAVVDALLDRPAAVATLMVLGGRSPGWVRMDTERVLSALPHAHPVVLEGEEHMAHYTAPEILARHLLDFCLGSRGPLTARGSVPAP